jgi:hypothetical protein
MRKAANKDSKSQRRTPCGVKSAQDFKKQSLVEALIYGLWRARAEENSKKVQNAFDESWE